MGDPNAILQGAIAYLTFFFLLAGGIGALFYLHYWREWKK